MTDSPPDTGRRRGLPPPETWPHDLRASLSLRVAADLPVAVAEQADAGIALAFPDGRFRFANDRFCEIVGRSREALVTRTIADITQADDWTGCSAQLDRLLRFGEPFDAEKRFVRPDGTCVWVRNTVSVLRNGSGAVDSLISFVFDIDERRRNETALRKREQELARVQRIGGVGGFDVDVAGGLVGRRSPEYLRLHGLPPDVLTETHEDWLRRVHPEDRARAERALRAALNGTGGVYESEYRIVRPSDHQIRWLSAVADIERDAQGRALRLIGAHIDITERKRVDAELEGSERRLRGLLDGLPQLVWRAHPRGDWTWASPQWTAFTGLSEADSREQGWLDAVPEVDRGVARAAWRESEARGVLDFHHRVRHAASGQDRWFHSRALAVRDARGVLIEWLGTSTDVDEQVRASEALARSSEELEQRVAQRTADLQLALATLRREGEERRRVEERLLQSEKLKAIGQLSGGIAHDFNNLLQVLTTGLEVMRRNLERGQVADLRKDIERAKRATRRAAALTQRLLAFGRQQHLSPRPVTFDQVAHDIEDMVRRSVGPGVQVELQLHASNWLVECDVGQMESALLNLCVNARDAMPDGGWLTISTAELVLSSEDALHIADAHPGRYACIAVSDTGVGMSDELQGRVFEPFFTTKPQGRGTGLGLSQIYGFVRQSGGLVQLHSRVGEGTTVRLMLPFHSRVSDEDEDADDSGRRTVLLVEDEDDVREITASTLRGFGYKVLEAGDGPTALRLVKSASRVDALVCDYGLPGGMNGQQVIDAIHELQPQVATIMATGYASGLIRPGITVMRKPFEIQDLANRIEAQLQCGDPRR